VISAWTGTQRCGPAVWPHLARPAADGMACGSRQPRHWRQPVAGCPSGQRRGRRPASAVARHRWCRPLVGNSQRLGCPGDQRTTSRFWPRGRGRAVVMAGRTDRKSSRPPAGCAHHPQARNRDRNGAGRRTALPVLAAVGSRPARPPVWRHAAVTGDERPRAPVPPAAPRGH